MEFLNTDIKNFDKLLGGGIPKGHLMLLVGPTGSGKTILASQFTANCISKHKLNCLYLTFEEQKKTLESNFDNFSWKLNDSEKEKLNIIKYNPYEFTAVTDILSTNIKKHNIDLVILDSLTGLSLFLTEQKDIKNTLIDMQQILKENNCTAIITSQIETDSNSMNRLGFEEALVDGVIRMYYNHNSLRDTRAMGIWKIRNVKHECAIFPYEINQEGIKIYNKKIKKR